MSTVTEPYKSSRGFSMGRRGSSDSERDKEKITGITGIPCSWQWLIHGGSQLDEESVISARDSTVHLVARLPGGKGGFGSLLRGAATKPGHKKTNNFDACRDMSGRRLRHVNAEKRLEEWKAEEDERRLERVAEDFIKKEAKKKGAGKAGAADRAAAKYVEGYREQSAKCVEVVEEAVKEAYALALKRKGKALLNAPSDSKKLKIWMGKRKMGESDSEDGSDNEDDGQENGISTVTSNGNHADLKAETDASSESVTGGGLGGHSSGGASSKSGSDSSSEEKEAAVERPGLLAELLSSEVNDPAQPNIHEDALQKSSGLTGSQAAEVSCNVAMKSEDCSNIRNTEVEPASLVGEILEQSGSGAKSEAHAVAVAGNKGGRDLEKPLRRTSSIMDVNGDGTLQIFARLLDGKTRVLRFGAGHTCSHEIREKIAGFTGIPCSWQRLIHGGSQLDEESVVLALDSTMHLVARLPGGKGGFRSLLRGAATKPGHKKMNNFDACRDMSGRRLRHVDAEKRPEEWKAEEDERRLERVAEDFIKEEAKKKGAGKAGAADRAAAKYVEGYREQSAKCVEVVEEAVKEAC